MFRENIITISKLLVFLISVKKNPINKTGFIVLGLFQKQKVFNTSVKTADIIIPKTCFHKFHMGEGGARLNNKRGNMRKFFMKIIKFKFSVEKYTWFVCQEIWFKKFSLMYWLSDNFLVFWGWSDLWKPEPEPWNVPRPYPVMQWYWKVHSFWYSIGQKASILITRPLKEIVS